MFRTIAKWRQSARQISLNSLLTRFKLGHWTTTAGIGGNICWLALFFIIFISADSFENNLITLVPSLVATEESFKCL